MNSIWRFMRYPVLAATIALGIYIILFSYHTAAAEGITALVTSSFWVGYFVLVLPQIFIILHPDSQFWSRVSALTAVGLLSAIPKILRAPESPLYSDEFGHLKTVSDILEQGYISPINPIVSPAPSFPAMHYLTAFISDITQFSIWTSANIVAGLVHVLTLLGIFALLRVKVSPRAAAIASLIYAANPNWMFFQSRFAYESMGIMLVFWALFFVVRGIESPYGQRLVMLITAGPLFFVLSQTHHISFVAGIILALIYLTIYSFKNYKKDPTTLMLSVGSLLWIGLWSLPALLNHGGYLFEYISYTLNRPTRSNIPFILESLGLSDSEIVSSEIEIATTYASLPMYEIVAGALLPLILAAVLFVYIFRGVKSAGSPRNFALSLDTFQIFALIMASSYFAFLPLVFSGEYTFVRRSWSFLLLGFAIIGAIAYENYLLSVPKKQRAKPPYWKQMNAIFLIGFILISYASLANGATAAQRFPSPEFQLVHSTESTRTQELQELAEWAKGTIPDNSWVMADRYTRLALTYPGRLLTAPIDPDRFPFWKLYLNPETPDEAIAKSAKALGVQYLVAHKLTFVIPTSYGYWFHPEEFNSYEGTDFYDYNIVEKFAKASWVETVWDSDTYVVYRVNWDTALEGVSQ